MQFPVVTPYLTDIAPLDHMPCLVPVQERELRLKQPFICPDTFPLNVGRTMDDT